MNDGIPKDLCGLTYITIITVIEHILTTGPGTLLAKINIKNAFRRLPVHPADCHMLVMKWNNQVYINTCLAFGLRSTPKLFNILADLLSWIIESKGVSPILHYLDDFLTMGPPSSTTCLGNLNIIKELCMHLGVPLALEKLEGPTQSLTFLGIVLDTSRMKKRLPEDKLSRIRTQLTIWLGKKKATKREFCLWLVYFSMRLMWLDLGRPLSQECTALLPKFKNCTITPGSTKTFDQTSTVGMSLSAIGMVSVCSKALPMTTTMIIASRQMPQGHGLCSPLWQTLVSLYNYGPMSGVQIP